MGRGRGKKREALIGAGACLASGAYLMGEAESTLMMPREVFSSHLPALLCESRVQSLKLCPGDSGLLSGSALLRWVGVVKFGFLIPVLHCARGKIAAFS